MLIVWGGIRLLGSLFRSFGILTFPMYVRFFFTFPRRLIFLLWAFPWSFASLFLFQRFWCFVFASSLPLIGLCFASASLLLYFFFASSLLLCFFVAIAVVFVVPYVPFSLCFFVLMGKPFSSPGFLVKVGTRLECSSHGVSAPRWFWGLDFLILFLALETLLS